LNSFLFSSQRATRGVALLLGILTPSLAAAQTQAPTFWGTQQPATTGTARPAGAAPTAPGPSKQPTATEQQLAQSEREDSGRGLEWFWLQAEGGGAWAAATSLSNDKLMLPGTSTGGGAGLLGVALGARLLFFTVGARARMAFVSDYKLISFMPEVGAHVPLGRWEPYAFVGAGYATLSGLPSFAGTKVSTSGFDARVGAGTDYYLTPTFSVGGLLTADFLFLGRPSLGQTAAHDAVVKGSGSGTSFAGSVVLGLHF
jgi:hypothetical protein